MTPGWLSLLQVEAVQLIADGKAPRIPQLEAGASYEGIQRKSNAKVRAAGQWDHWDGSFHVLPGHVGSPLVIQLSHILHIREFNGESC